MSAQPILTRRRLLLGAGGALLLGAAGCALRVRSTGPDGRPLDDARQAPAPGAVQHLGDVAQVEFDWHDAQRERAVPVRLYLPPARARAPRPLLLFSHGLGGSRRGYRWLGMHFARQGWLALHVQHVGSDRALWGGNAFELAGRLQAAAREQEAVARVADQRFALDRLLAGIDGAEPALAGLGVDARRIVTGGHSYGANTALLVSGARVQRAGRAVDLRDARIASALLLSAPPFYGEEQDGALRAILQPVRLPTLHVTATGDEIRVPGYYSPAADRIAVFEAAGSAHKALAVFDGGHHSMFTDRSAPGGVELNAAVKAATRELATAFLASALDGEHAALRAWPAQHRAILARFDGPPALA